MAHYNRRRFIKESGGTFTAISLGALMSGCHKGTVSAAKWTGFKYAMCNESMGRLSWRQQCQIVADAGYEGIEVAAFALVKEGVQEIDAPRRKEMVSIMQDVGIQCAGLHWLLSPPPHGLHFTTPDAAVRKKTLAYFDELIDFCGDLGGPCMIFGSPKQRSTAGISVKEANKYFADSLTGVADHAQQRRVKILIEPLGKSVTDVVNTLAEALDLAEQVNHPAIQLVFDFHNTTDETEPLDVLIEKYFAHIHHVHVQEMNGKHLGAGTAVNDYVKSFQTLKDLRYDKWISLEVFDFSPGGKTIAQESMRALKEIEAKLT